MDEERHALGLAQCTVALVAALASFSLPGRPANSAVTSGGVINTTVCELVADPLRFNGKIVEFGAHFESDGLENTTLSDSNCRGGVKPEGNTPILSQGGRAFEEALRHGCPGTIDKEITATWVGVFHYQPQNTPGTGRVPRWIDLSDIANLEVRRKQNELAASCPP